MNMFSLWKFIRCITVFGITGAALIDDLKRFKISNSIILLGAAVAVLLNLAEALLGNSFRNYLIGGASAFGMMMGAYCIHALGAGDVKLLTVLGFLAGKSVIYKIIVWAFLYTGILGGICLIIGKKHLKTTEKGFHVIHFSKALVFAEGIIFINFLLKGAGNV